MLYRSLTSCQKLLAEVYRSRSCEKDCGLQLSTIFENEINGIPLLIKMVKREITKPTKESIRKSSKIGQTLDQRGLLVGLDNISSSRNKLAHNKKFSETEIRGTLLETKNVLAQFSCVSEKTEAGLESRG